MDYPFRRLLGLAMDILGEFQRALRAFHQDRSVSAADGDLLRTAR
jgi:membrane protein required for beta-lactamase induction